MTRGEIRGLIGGYATGSLTEAERRMLFEAALEDQELFDELAREQALKEVLEEPAAKLRLIAAVAPQPNPWWRTAWVWAAAGAAAVVVITGIRLWQSGLGQEPKQEIARVELPQAPAQPATLPAPVPVPVRPALKAVHPAPEPTRKVTPRVKKAAPLPASPPSASIGELATVSPPVPAQAVAPVPQASLGGVVGGVPAGVPGGIPGGVQAGSGGGGGGARGGRGGAVAASRALVRPQAAPASRFAFAFDYSVTPEGLLRIVPAANGFLSVVAVHGSAHTQLFLNRPLQAGAATEIQLPASSESAVVVFSARETTASFPEGASADLPSGTKSDPNPSPDSRLIAVIPVKR